MKIIDNDLDVETDQLKIKVKYFNLAREKSGTGEEEIRLQKGGTASDLLERLKLKHSADYCRYFFDDRGDLRNYIRMVRIKDSRQLKPDYTLSDNEEIYLFVATSGG